MKRQEFTPLKGPKHHIRVPPFSPVGYHLARGIHIGENPARKFIPALNLPGWRCPTKRHKTGLKLRTQKGITFTQHGSWWGATGILVFREREISPVLVILPSFPHKKWTLQHCQSQYYPTGVKYCPKWPQIAPQVGQSSSARRSRSAPSWRPPSFSWSPSQRYSLVIQTFFLASYDDHQTLSAAEFVLGVLSTVV